MCFECLLLLLSLLFVHVFRLLFAAVIVGGGVFLLSLFFCDCCDCSGCVVICVLLSSLFLLVGYSLLFLASL